MYLLTFISIPELKNGFEAYDIDQICMLAAKYYPEDFTSQENHNLRYQVQHFLCDVQSTPNMRNVNFYQNFVQSWQRLESQMYIIYLID